MLGTPSREQIKTMNPNYMEHKFPQIKVRFAVLWSEQGVWAADPRPLISRTRSSRSSARVPRPRRST